MKAAAGSGPTACLLFHTVFLSGDSVMKSILNFIRQEEGASAAEYALMLALIGVAITGALVTLRTAIVDTITTAASQL
jgi:pilus assembly protein Flp/PilA